MQTPKGFFDSLGGSYFKVGGEPVVTMPAVYEAMRLYGEHVAKHVKRKADAIAMDENATYRRRNIMNIKLEYDAPE